LSQHRLVHALTVVPPRVRRIAATALAAAVLVGGGFGIMHGHRSTPAPATAVRTEDRASRDLARPTATDSSAATSEAPTPAPTTPPAPAPVASTTKAAPATTAPRPVAPVAPAAGCSAYSGNRLVACNMLPSFGFSVAEMAALDPLWQRESGWSTSAANSSGAYGIPQALPGSKMASAGSDWQTNPATQISWGLSYIKGRYGSPSAAWSFWQSHSWY
jgi:colicin import membrane protein